MKKITLLLMLCAFAIAQGQAQKLSDEIKLTTGEPYAVVDAKSKEYVGVGDGITISVKTRGEIVIVQRYDTQSMTETDRQEYKDFPPYLKFEDLKMIDGKLYYFFSSYLKKEKKFEVYARMVNTNTGKFEDYVLLAKTEGTVVNSNGIRIGQQAAPIGILPSHFTITPAFDESKFLVSYKRKPVNKKNSENKDILGFFMFENNLKPIWGQEVEMPFTEDQFMINAMACTSKGTAHILGKMKEDNQFVMLSMDQDARIQKVELDINAELFFQKFMITEDGGGNLNVAGIYANGLDFKMGWGGGTLSFNTNGILIAKIDPFNGVIDSKDHEFPIDFINLYQSERQKEKNEKREDDGKAGINDLVLKEFISYEDGGALIVAEQDFYRSEYVFGQGNITVHRFEDIVMLRTNADGSIAWMRRLPKTQIVEHTGVRNGCGIKYANSPSGHYVLFLDNVNNAEIGPDDVPAAHKDGKGGFLTAYKISDTDGKSEKYTIANILDINGTEAHQFSPSRIFKVDESVFLLEMYIKGKKDNMVKMEFN